MPINVACPECHLQFHVGDEFAGRTGRCPECAAIMQVPAPAVPAHPFNSPPAVGSFPAQSRRPREDVRARQEPSRRDDYDDQPRERPFDPHARAARWRSVSNGLWNLTVAVILLTLAPILTCVFWVVDGVRPGQQNNFARAQALLVGDTLVLSLALVLWARGRIGCGRVPYVPARRVASPAGVIAGLTALGGVTMLVGIAGGLMIAQKNQGLAVLMLLIGMCAILPTMFGLLVAEVMGLVAQRKIALGLRDTSFAHASRVLFVVSVVLAAVTFFGWFGLMFFQRSVEIKLEEEQRQQLELQKKENPKADQPPEVQPPAAAPKAKWKGKGKGKNGPPGQPGPADEEEGPPPPEMDWGEYPQVVYGTTIGVICISLAYALTAVVCFHLGRVAVRREIGRLVGDPHDRDGPHDPHY